MTDSTTTLEATTEEEPASSASSLEKFLQPLIADSEVHVYIREDQARVGLYEQARVNDAIVTRNVDTHVIKDSKVISLIKPSRLDEKKYSLLHNYLIGQAGYEIPKQEIPEPIIVQRKSVLELANKLVNVLIAYF